MDAKIKTQRHVKARTADRAPAVCTCGVILVCRNRVMMGMSALQRSDTRDMVHDVRQRRRFGSSRERLVWKSLHSNCQQQGNDCQPYA
ncbi:hypothetical protein [Donghicola eburneus]|uniref:hypothetical protein n=1 Tax=Donghicola eburneus TaxID=393278 RepID=UPI000B87B68D|nr:hypothetical protein [Donghicola eburneus]